MNMKAVIVWIVAVVIFAAIGLFGMANQDLLKKDTPAVTPPNPTVQTRSESCTATTQNGHNSTYSFTMDENNVITNIAITYQATTQIDGINASAFALANAQINGVSITKNDTDTGFVLLINVNPQNYDAETLANYQNDLLNLSTVINNVTDVESYKSAINATGNVYNCS